MHVWMFEIHYVSFITNFIVKCFETDELDQIMKEKQPIRAENRWDINQYCLNSMVMPIGEYQNVFLQILLNIKMFWFILDFLNSIKMCYYTAFHNIPLYQTQD